MAKRRYFSSKNREATALRKRKYQLVRRFGLPEDALGGHWAMTYRRCNKPTCHCVDGLGHPIWTLSYSFEGKKQVEVLPEALAMELRPLVEQGREIREATMELLAINLQLLHLWRVEQRNRAVAKSNRPKQQTAVVKRRKKSHIRT